jgi:STE24 endopeptidase
LEPAPKHRQDFDPSRDVPGLDVARAKRYSRIRLALLAAGTAWGTARTATFAFSGGSAALRDLARSKAPHPALAAPAYVAATVVASWVGRLPLAYVGGHRVERAFGLTKQTTRGWLGDEGKGLAIGLAFQVPATCGAYALIRRRPRDWWLILSGLTVPLAAVLSQLAPVVIMPIFNRFEPLADRELAGRVTALSERAGVRIADVYRMDMSRQSERANAFFTGLGATKRIVLGDTLLDRFTPKEIEGVVAHELGHQVHGDIWRLVALAGAFGFGAAYLLAKVGPAVIDRTSYRTGVTELGDVASLPLLEVLLALGGAIAVPIQSAVSRAIERRTDRYALELTGDGETYAAAMGRLAAQNLADPDPPKAIVLLLYSHPPIAERIRTARSFASEGELRASADRTASPRSHRRDTFPAERSVGSS